MLPDAELWTEVILQAIRDQSSPDPNDRRGADFWIISSRDKIGSFVWACHVTEIDPSFVRSVLRKAQAAN